MTHPFRFQSEYKTCSTRIGTVVIIFSFLLRFIQSFPSSLVSSRSVLRPHESFHGTTSMGSISRRAFTFQRHYYHHYDSTRLYFGDRNADMMEVFVGGMRYEMVELPDSLVDTTIFVGNLCEFVSDEDLSALFQQVSALNFLPACVARKPNSSSLCYGFVTFPTVQEKESAIVRFSGYVLNDKAIRVEPIIDHKFRVRVPEKLVSYSLGPAKQLRGGAKNTLRQVSESISREGAVNQKTNQDKSRRRNKKSNRSDGDAKMKSKNTSASSLSSSVRPKDLEKRLKRKLQKKLDQFHMGDLL